MKIDKMIKLNEEGKFRVVVIRHHDKTYSAMLMANSKHKDYYETTQEYDAIFKVDNYYWDLESQREPIRHFKTLDAIYNFFEKNKLRQFEVITNTDYKP